MSRVDYSQVPECAPPDMRKRYRIDYQASPMNFDTKKWIDGKYLNLNKKRTLLKGSKGYVGLKKSTGGWSIIRIYRVV
jgi:hypothetical protein